MIGKRILSALGTIVLGASLIVPLAHAKCPKACSQMIRAEGKACKAACPKGKAGKQCKVACAAELRADKLACKHAPNPTPPGCGEGSPSGAFLNAFGD